MSASKRIEDVTPSEEEVSTEINKYVVCEVEGCLKTFSSGGSYLLHKTKTHPSNNQSTSLLKKYNGDVVYRYHCPVSSCLYHLPSERHFTSLKYLKQHYGKVHGEKKYICHCCKKGFAFERDMKRHTETCGIVFKCVTCGCPYTTPEAVLTHCRRKQHEAPESARSSRRGVKQLLKEKKSFEKRNLTHSPCIIIINQTGQPISVPDACVATNSSLSELTLSLPKLLPVPQSNVTSAALMQPQLKQPVKRHSLPKSKSNSKCRKKKGTLMEYGSSFEVKTAPYSTSTPLVSQLNPDDISFSSMYSSSQQTVAGIQTDIYGVETLYLNSVSVASTGTQADSSLNYMTETSSTGMQTSMSFIPTKKRDCSIAAGTQTFTDNILDKALKTAQIPTQTQMSCAKKLNTREVQTTDLFSSKKKKQKISGSESCDPDPSIDFQISFDDLATNWTQTNLSYLNSTIQQRQDQNPLQNIETQTTHLSPQHDLIYSSENDFLPQFEAPCEKQLLKENLNLLAEATLTNYFPMNVNDIGLGTSSENIKRFTLGDPALSTTFSTSMDSESQTMTSASDLDILLQTDGQVAALSTAQGTDIHTQTVDDELLAFLMNNMETQTTEDLLFPEFGLSDIETQTLNSGSNPTSDTNVACQQTDYYDSNVSSQISSSLDTSSVITQSNIVDDTFLLDSLVNTETQTNVQFFNNSDLTLLSDMETQTTFNTVDFYTNFTDSHTQTSFF